MSPDRHFDALETRSIDEREHSFFSLLPAFLRGLATVMPAWERRFGGIDLASIVDRQALARLPVLRKSDLVEIQLEAPPFGGLAPQSGARVFMSPGPIFENQGLANDPWGLARALFAAGFRRGELLHNTFSYHLTPGGFMLDEGARALGLRVFPAGPGNTEMQIDAICRLKPAGYSGTPDYLKVILDAALEKQRDVSSLRKALVSGGALFQSLRDDYLARGITVKQAYATADCGCIAYESAAGDGLIVNENIIIEIVRPGTGDIVAEGEVGEVVVTALNEAWPLIRFGTGDLSAFLPGASPCGRTNRRIEGWLGRADQTTKIKGMFVHPSQIAEVGRRHPELGRLRLVVGRHEDQDAMVLHAESQSADEGLARAIAGTLSSVTKLNGSVKLVPAGTLANDGKVIADERQYD